MQLMPYYILKTSSCQQKTSFFSFVLNFNSKMKKPDGQDNAYRVFYFKAYASQSSTSRRGREIHLPFVKSGISTGIEPRRSDFSLSAVIAIQVAAS